MHILRVYDNNGKKLSLRMQVKFLCITSEYKSAVGKGTCSNNTKCLSKNGNKQSQKKT